MIPKEACPHCGNTSPRFKGARPAGKVQWQCKACGKYWTSVVTGKKESMTTDKKVGAFDWREWTPHLAERQRLHEKASFSQDAAIIRIETEYPCIVWKPMSDLHIGDIGADYSYLAEFTDKVLSIPYLYLSLSGDEEDNFVSFKNQLAVLQQILSPEEQDAFVESWLSEIGPKVLFAGWGNHAEFEEKVSGRNTLKHLLNHHVAYFNGIGIATIQVNGQTYRAVSTHRTRYNSSFNKTHGLKQLARRDIPDADIYLSGHIHDPAYEVSFERGREQVFIVLGSIKHNDGFAKRYFSYFSARRDAALVLDSREHRIGVFPCLDDALSYAEAVNSRQPAA